ncbi:MAG: hypothetical protein GX617_06575 [Lentisphaerae bacterium]|nr:hypothetical protein [Lentisphaerota bacterium]
MRERDTPPGRAASQETPSAAEGGSASADERFALRITGSRPRRQQALTDRATTPEGILVRGVIDLRQAEALDGDVSPTLIATDFKGGKAVCVDVANGGKSEKHRGAHASLSDTSAAPALNECNDREVMPAPDAVESGTGGVLGFIKNDAGSSREGYWADVFPTVRSQVTPAVAMEVCDGDPTGSNHGVPAVRRLLPVECERLMGFPDDWTKIPWIGRPADECPDAPRYRACGNSMCVNVMSWIGRRIDNVEKEMVANAGRTDS